VGDWFGASGGESGFLRDPSGHLSTFSFFRHPGADGHTHATAINDEGLVAGYEYRGSGPVRGFVYDPATGHFSTLTVPGTASTYIGGINDAGVVSGFYFDRQGDLFGFVGTLSPVPEPAASVLMTSGLLAALAYLRMVRPSGLRPSPRGGRGCGGRRTASGGPRW
jgi:hypothetical protein